MTRRTHQADFNEADDVESYMQNVVSDHVDPLTGEVNTTALAEDAAHEWRREDWLDDETHPVWDIAVDVATAHESACSLFL